MAKAAFCPHCGYGGNGATFIEQDLVAVNAEFRLVVSDSGELEHDWTGESEVFWDTQVPACDIDLGTTPRYRCPECDEEFDEFVIRDVDTEEGTSGG